MMIIRLLALSIFTSIAYCCAMEEELEEIKTPCPIFIKDVPPQYKSQSDALLIKNNKEYLDLSKQEPQLKTTFLKLLETKNSYIHSNIIFAPQSGIWNNQPEMYTNRNTWKN